MWDLLVPPNYISLGLLPCFLFPSFTECKASCAIKHLPNFIVILPEIFIIFKEQRIKPKLFFSLSYSGCSEVSILTFHNFTTYFLHTNQFGQFLHLVFHCIFHVCHNLSVYNLSNFYLLKFYPVLQGLIQISPSLEFKPSHCTSCNFKKRISLYLM